ncbi:tRNA threonylcarbamoyladenosine biosynthesis protein TsaE [invertebrate metagenome]|uniref:tRNA threonylcarbamoyladenosine biosynthesis protein TsaE n=1 Tax=invertebrate metagenome TaxID=1711999 RepID=A0A2H9T5Z3_9ZZZZ
MQKSCKLMIHNESNMVRLGELIARACEHKGILFLEGELGAGKTTLCRGILRHLGHKGSVKSPTYTLVEPYQIGSTQIYHFDLYRLADPEELEFIGARDYFCAEDVLCLVEWPDRGLGVLPEPDMHIMLDYHVFENDSVTGRLATLTSNTSRGQQVISRIEQQWEDACRQ